MASRKADEAAERLPTREERIMSAQYIVNEKGERVSVILPLEEYQAIQEDLEDLAAVAERRDEPTVSHEELIRRLQADGLL